MRKPAVYLDRDGVINRNRHDYIRSIDDWVPIPGSIDAMVRLSNSGYPVIVVTNQSAIARGYCTENQVSEIHRHLASTVENAGGVIDGIYYCPHHPDDGCQCRKPEIGMVESARTDLDLGLDGYLVGDAASDIEMGIKAGLLTILVLTGRGPDQMKLISEGNLPKPWRVVSDLSEAVGLILDHSESIEIESKDQFSAQ